jgi:methyl-accepting chemotaxis protein PixJ
VLECDRVVVYSLNEDQYGVVIAESVAPGYSRALNKTISDPCFEARYLDKYRDGRVRAINNLQEAELSKCYLEQLESLEVKANLVTPILNEGKLFGLLVAHQCSQPRNWQEHEIRWVTQIATQVGFALDNAKVLRRLKNEGVPIQFLKSFTLGIGERLNEAELLKTGELTQAQPTSRNIANEQQLKLQSFEQQISELLQENKVSLQDLRAKINYQSQATSIFLERIEAASDEVKSIAAVQKTIAEATEKIEHLNQSHQNLYQILSPFNDLKKQINQDNHSSIIAIAETVNPPSHQLAGETVQMESLMGEIIIETNEVAFKPTKNLDFEQNAIAGQIVQGTESAPSLMLMNQFVEEIANLSGRISQQSVVVTNSFKKLAAFAKELSINKEED